MATRSSPTSTSRRPHATAPYRNSYTWYLRLNDGAIVDVVAFFDSIAMDDLWTRVQPA